MANQRATLNDNPPILAGLVLTNLDTIGVWYIHISWTRWPILYNICICISLQSGLITAKKVRNVHRCSVHAWWRYLLDPVQPDNLVLCCNCLELHNCNLTSTSTSSQCKSNINNAIWSYEQLVWMVPNSGTNFLVVPLLPCCCLIFVASLDLFYFGTHTLTLSDVKWLGTACNCSITITININCTTTFLCLIF